MENILDALKAMKKATAREVAARLQIEQQAALDMLREHEDRFEAVQSNGYWWPTRAGDAPQKSVPQKAVPPVRITPFDLKGVLMEKGPLQADQLAKITGATAKGVATMLTNLVTKGEVSREKVGNKFVYSVPATPVDSVPETAAPPVSPVQADPVPAVKTTAEIEQAIPAFTARTDDLVIPSSRFISQEIRRTRTKLANLEKLQVTVRELRRHKKLINQIV